MTQSSTLFAAPKAETFDLSEGQTKPDGSMADFNEWQLNALNDHNLQTHGAFGEISQHI